jgi:hypothetical protein
VVVPEAACMKKERGMIDRDHDRSGVDKLCGCPSPGYKARNDKSPQTREGGTSHGNERKAEIS